MKTNIVEAVKFCFISKVVQQISQTVDESEREVERALEKAIPLVLESLLLRLERPGGPAALLQLAHEAHEANLLPYLAQLQTTAWYARGAGLVRSLAGDGYEGVVNRIMVVAGVRHPAAATLLSVAAAAVLSVLGRYAAENELTAAEFAAWFQSQRTEVTMALFPDVNRRALTPDHEPETQPGTVSTRPASGTRFVEATSRGGVWTAVDEGATYTPQPETNLVTASAPASTSFRWQWPLLLLLAVSLGYYFGHDRLTTGTNRSALVALSGGPAAATAANTSSPAARPGTPAGTYDADRDTYIYDTGQPIILTLADGTTQKVGANSTENRLYTFLASPALQVDSVNRTKGWINFDRVYFEAGKATLTPESEQQLNNVARVLKTFPKTIVKLGGYTDSTGNSLQNLFLSEARAKAALLALASQGINPDQLQAKGYGAKYFVASNATPEGRALNRRISIRVVQK